LVNRGAYLLTALLFTVMFLAREVAARNFVLNVGHLRDGGSQWCNRLHKGPIGPVAGFVYGKKLGKKG